VNEFGFQGGTEALDNGIVPPVHWPTHRTLVLCGRAGAGTPRQHIGCHDPDDEATLLTNLASLSSHTHPDGPESREMWQYLKQKLKTLAGTDAGRDRKSSHHLSK
jgi:hypothetical protein